MAAYRRVYDSRHLQADCQRTGISSGILRSVIEYGLALPSLAYKQSQNCGRHAQNVLTAITEHRLQAYSVSYLTEPIKVTSRPKIGNFDN